MEPDQYHIPLPLDLVEPIANCLLADDIIDYISFRTVCRDWRSLTASTRSFASQFRPRQWIMLPNFEKNPSAPAGRFLNLFTGRSLILNHLPELESHSVISVCDGILVLLHKETLIMCIFNPFTRHMSDYLPPFEAEYGFSIKIRRNHKIMPMYFQSIMISDDFPCPTLIIYIPFGNIFFAKPGDCTWKCMQCYNSMHLIMNTFFDGKIYYISHTNQICATKPEQKHATSLIPLPYDAGVSPSVLVKFGSDLLLVRQIGELTHENFEIFRVDLELNILVQLNYLGEYALFISVNRQTIIVSSQSFPSIKSNSIYCFLLDSNTTYAPKYIPSAQTAFYSLNDQRIELLSNIHNGDLIHPCTLADYLFKYCSML